MITRDPNKTYCPHCRKEIPENALVCHYCGRTVQRLPIGNVEAKSPPPTVNPVRRKSNRTTTFLAIAIVVLLAVAAAGFLLRNNGTSPAPTVPRIITVSGTATSSGSGTSVSQVLFTNSYGAQYAGQVSDGHFAISLPNPGSYSVEVKWVGTFYWQGGTINVSPLNVDASAGSSDKSTESINVSTPDSTVYVTGTAQCTELENESLQLTFSSSNGGTFSAQVVDGVYSISLPNNQLYSVQISAGGGTNYPTTFQAGYIDVNSYPGFDTFKTSPFSC